MSERVRVRLPKSSESTIIEWTEEGMPGVGTVFHEYAAFPGQRVFRWHLSLVFTLRECNDHELPTEEESELLYAYEDVLTAALCGGKTPNAFLFARLNVLSERELVFRVFQPRPAHEFLQKVISEETYPQAGASASCATRASNSPPTHDNA